MLRSLRAASCALVMSCMAAVVDAQTPIASSPADAALPTYYPEVTMPGSQQRVMRSRVGNRDYRILIAEPTGPPPPAGFPVIYVLDGNAHFETMVYATRLQASPDRQIGPAVVVGIGYQTDTPLDKVARRYDLTPPLTDKWQPPQEPGASSADGIRYGGESDFLRFITEDLQPRISREFRVDPTRQAIFGQSLGGLFVLHVLFTRPRAFSTYIAASPSIWWDNDSILNEEKAFAAHDCRADLRVSVLLTSGDLERRTPLVTVPGAVGRTPDDAKAMAERLAGLKRCAVRAVYQEFAGEGHVSAIPAEISRSVRFWQRPAQ